MSSALSGTIGTLIWWLFIITIIIKQFQKRKNGKNTEKNYSASADRPSAASLPPDVREKAVPKSTGAPDKKSAEYIRARDKAYAARAAAKKQEEEPVSESTTEFLRKKALKDEIEHAREKQEDTQRLLRESGGRPAAWRYLEGESVPADMRIVLCSYCGAQNLVSASRDKASYNCYFCRESL